jgi:hypothetical protein
VSGDAIREAATGHSMKEFHLWCELLATENRGPYVEGMGQPNPLTLNSGRWRNYLLTRAGCFSFGRIFSLIPDSVSEEAMAKFDELVKISKAHGVGLIPTFFTGHMSGENWDVPWRSGRDPYEDPFMLRAQVRLVREFALRYKDEDAILLWDLSNEPDIFAKPKSVDAAWLWTHLLYRELKTYDPERQGNPRYPCDIPVLARAF